MKHRVVKVEKLTKEDFKNGAISVLLKEGLKGLTFGKKLFAAKDVEIVQEVYNNPYYIFQIMNLIAKDKELLEACFDVLERRIKSAFFTRKEAIDFINLLNEVLKELGLPAFMPDIREQIHVRCAD